MAAKIPYVHEADSFIREVDEDLREERLRKLWRKYGYLTISVAIVLVILVGGYEIWKQWKGKQAIAYALRYDKAVALVGSDRTADEGIAILTTLATEASAGYRAIALLQQAATLAGRGEVAIALATWRRVIVDHEVPRPYREAAIVLMVLNGMNTLEHPELATFLSPLMDDYTSPWRFSALELTAVLAIHKSDFSTARSILTKLVDDPQVPTGIRSRAEATRQVLSLPTNG